MSSYLVINTLLPENPESPGLEQLLRSTVSPFFSGWSYYWIKISSEIHKRQPTLATLFSAITAVACLRQEFLPPLLRLPYPTSSGVKLLSSSWESFRHLPSYVQLPEIPSVPHAFSIMSLGVAGLLLPWALNTTPRWDYHNFYGYHRFVSTFSKCSRCIFPLF